MSTTFRADITVMLKPSVNDPQGLTIKGALHSLGFAEVDSVRAGKYMELRLEAKNKKAAEEQVNEMCDKLLANPVIEEYRFEIAAAK